MKNRQVRNRLLPLLVVATTVGFYSAAQAQVVNHTVQMSLNEAQTVLDVDTRGRCANNNHNGCIEVAPGTQARIQFTMVGENLRHCTRPGGSHWKIGEVYLGGKGSTGKPSSWGGFQNDAEVQADFSFANAATGQLNKGSGSNQNSIIVHDSNSSPNGYDIWYKVTAVCVDSGGDVIGEVETDPRIKNGGTQ